MAEIERLKKILAAYQIKRSVDGLNGRMWYAHVHLLAEEYIRENDPVITSGIAISTASIDDENFSIEKLIEKAAGMI